MKNKILLLFLLALSFSGKSQKSFISLKNVTTSGVTDTVDNAPILVSSTGNVIISGNQKISPTQYDATTASQISNGIVQWTNLFNTSTEKCFVIASTLDASNNVYVCGGIRVAGSGTGLDYFIIKYDNVGAQQWVQYYNGPNSSTDIASGIYFDDPNNVLYVTGVSDGTLGAVPDYATLKLDGSTGNIIWTSRYDYGSYDAPWAVTVDPGNGLVIVMGSSATTFTDWDVATVSYDPTDGTQKAVDRQANGTSTDMVFGMTTDSLGNIYSTGRTANDIQVLKLDTALNTVWVQSYNGYGFDDAGLSIALDDSLNVYVTGFTYRNSTERELVLLKYDKNGNLKWSRKKYPAVPGSTAEGVKVVVKNMNEIFVGGHSNTNSNQDISILRFNKDGRQTLEGKYNGPLNSTDKFLDFAIDPDTNLIFVSGRTYAGSNLDSNIVLTYKYNDIPEAVTFSASVPKRMTGQIFVAFQPSAMKDEAVNNSHLVHGELSDFLTPTAMANLNSVCGSSVSRYLCSKSIPTLTKNDSLSTTRSGRTIKIQSHWSSFIVYLPEVNDTVLMNQFKNAGTVVRWAYFNELAPVTAGADDTHYNNGNSAGLRPMVGIANAHINIEPAWNLAVGTPSVKVGVFDSGINFAHQDFGNGTFAGSKIAGGFNYYDNQSLSTVVPDDPSGHGTAVAGLIGAIRNNNFGIAGVAGGDADSSNTGVALYNMKTHDTISSNCGTYATSQARAAAIVQGAIKTPAIGFGLHVQNHSWTSTIAADMPIYEAMITAFDNEVTIVNTSGNDDQGPCQFWYYPANYPDRMLMHVGANDSSGARAGFSQCGGTLDFIAPGTSNLYSAPTRTASSFSDTALYSIQSQTCSYTFDGTSFAAPHVSGVAALLKSYDKKVLGPVAPFNPDVVNWYPEDLEEVMQLTTTDLTTGPNFPGYDPETGYGRVNAGNALLNVKYPDYIIWHLNTVVNASTAVLVGSNEVTCNWNNLYGITTPTTYVNRYRITATNSHTIPTGYNFIKGWDLDAASDVVGLNSVTSGSPNCNIYFNFPSKSLPAHHDVTSTVTASSANLVGYIYEVLTPTVPTTSLGWYPPQFAGLTGTVNLAYTVYMTTNPVGLKDENFQDNYISIYPNPANDKVILATTKERIENIDLKVYNLLGQLQIEEKNVSLNKEKTIAVPGLANGLYFFELTKSGTKIVKKIIISH